MTPLHTLSSSVGEGPSVPIAELLLLHKADPNATSDLGNTILHTASVVGDTPLVSLLLEQGADPAITNKGGFNPMMFAGLNNRTNIMRLFEERGMHLRKVTFNFEPSDIRSNSVHVEYRQTLNFALVKQKELEFRAFARTNVGARLHVQIKGQEAWNQIMNGSVPLQITQRFSQAGEADKWAAQLVGGTKYRSSPSQSRSRSKPPGNQTKVSNTAVVQL